MYHCPYKGLPHCRSSMIPHLIYYNVRDALGDYYIVESKTPIANCQDKGLPTFTVCKQCYFDYILQRLETVVAF